MADKLIEYRLRIRNAANSADALEVTSVRGGTNPWIAAEPRGDGASFDPNTGVVTSGSFTVRIVDPITSGTDRLVSSILEDANSRQQLGHRRAFIELREDGGAWQTLYSGRISRYKLASDIEWEITVSDWMKAEHEVTAFQPEPDETIADFLTRYPKRGCLAGGPVMGGFRTIPDKGGWIMRVRNAPVTSNRYRLEAVTCYGPGAWNPGANIYASPRNTGGPAPAAVINETVRSLPRGQHEFATVPFATVRDTYGPGVQWPGLVVLISDGSRTDEPWRPINPFTAGIRYGADLAEYAWLDLISGKPGEDGIFVYRDGQSALTVDSLVTVRVLTILPTPSSPIYFNGHVVDWISSLWDEAGVPYDASAKTTVRNALGTPQGLALQITKAEPLGRLLEATGYGPFGIAARQGADGELEMFTTRKFPTSLPAVTIDEDDVVEGTTEAFALDTNEAITRFALEHTKIYRHAIGNTVDGVILQPVRFERTFNDPGSIGTGEVSYSIPGEIWTEETIDWQLDDWVAGAASEVFERYGRGPVRLRTTLLRGGAGDSLQLGDTALFDLPQIPNANKRLLDAAVAARVMQITHLSITARGKEIEAVDFGPNAAQHGTVPTLTIALSSDRPRNVAAVTITNAATLNGQSASLRLQMATTTGAAPAAEDYSDIAYFEAAAIPTGAYRLPAVTHDLIVYVRARAEKLGARPSNWSSTANVNLDPLDPPTAVAAVAHGSDGTRAEITWTIGTDSTDALVEVWRSLAAEAFADAVLVATLPPGSNRYSAFDLAASTAYDFYIRHRDEDTGDLSATAQDDVTTGATAATLTAPTHPDGFSTMIGPPVQTFGLRPHLSSLINRYGIVVQASEIPSFIEVQEALETGVAAGTYGSFATVGTNIPSVSGDWTSWSNGAPNDGLRRKLKARHVRDGATASAYTAEIIVNPGTNDPIPQFPLNNIITTSLTDPSGVAVYGGRRRTHVYRNVTNQTIANTTDTAIAWTHEQYDVGGLHDTVTNNSRLTVPAGAGGVPVYLNATIRWAGSAANTRRIELFKNGVTGLASSLQSGDANGFNMHVAYTDVPADGDYYELFVWQNSGGNLDVQAGPTVSFFQLVFLS